jgi:hypothetical protein
VVKEATLNTQDSSNEALEQIEATKASEEANPEANEDIQNLITIRQPIFIVSTSGLSQVILWAFLDFGASAEFFPQVQKCFLMHIYC